MNARIARSKLSGTIPVAVWSILSFEQSMGGIGSAGAIGSAATTTSTGASGDTRAASSSSSRSARVNPPVPPHSVQSEAPPCSGTVRNQDAKPLPVRGAVLAAVRYPGLADRRATHPRAVPPAHSSPSPGGRHSHWELHSRRCQQ